MFPLIIYLIIAGVGYWSTGSNVPDIILNRDSLPGSKDFIFSLVKAGMLITLTVGIILRVQINRQGIVTIITQIFGSKKDDQRIGLSISPTMENDSLRQELNSNFSEEKISKNSLVPSLRVNDNVELKPVKPVVAAKTVPQEMSFLTRIILALIMTAAPALTGILVSDSFIQFISSGAGLFAPVFLIIYPSLMVIKLHNDGTRKISLISLLAVWLFLIVGGGISYSALIINIINHKSTD